MAQIKSDKRYLIPTLSAKMIEWQKKKTVSR